MCELRRPHSNRPLNMDFVHDPKRIDEFVFRFNRRTSRSRGLVFYRLLELAVGHGPVRYRDIAIGGRPRKVMPAAPSSEVTHPPSNACPQTTRGDSPTYGTPVS